MRLARRRLPAPAVRPLEEGDTRTLPGTVKSRALGHQFSLRMHVLPQAHKHRSSVTHTTMDSSSSDSLDEADSHGEVQDRIVLLGNTFDTGLSRAQVVALLRVKLPFFGIAVRFPRVSPPATPSNSPRSSHSAISPSGLR